jgi:spore photoproduct lyase
MSRLDNDGYPVRVRLSPVVPLAGWREAYARLIERIFAAAEPEMVTLWTLSMIDYEDLGTIVPPASLDGEIRQAAEEAADAMRGRKGAPFPAAARASIYRHLAELVRAHSDRARVALCLETPTVWDAIAPLLTSDGRTELLCNCGPRAIPCAELVTGRNRRSSTAPAGE